MLNLECLRVTSRSPRAGRQADRFAHTIRRLTEARRDDVEASGGGSADAPARTPRVFAHIAKKPDDGGTDSDGDGEPARRPQNKATRYGSTATPEMREPCRRLYRITTVMEQLDISRATVYRLIACGKLSLVKIGPHGSRIVGESIDSFISDQMEPQRRDKRSTNG